MTRILLAGVVGAVVYYIWGMAAWMLIPLHTPTLAGLPEQDAIRTALQSQDLQTGVYVIPWSDDESDWQEPESELSQNYRSGPLVSIYYRQDGSEPMPTRMLVGGFVIDLLAATLAACLLSGALGCCRGYASRVGFVLGLGIFVALVGHASYWNWMHFPAGYTIAFMVDVIVGWTLAGLAIAAIVRPEAKPEPAAADARQAPPAPKQPVPKSAAPTAPVRNDAITLLATLQREARLVDIVKEPLSDYSDAQIGAAARDVLRDCGAVLDRLFDLRAVVDQEEGASVEIPAGFDAGRYRITGNVARQAPYSASLVHPGWQATRCNLPQWTGSQDAAMIVAAAEVEIT